jgi:uncharacterized protein with ATP-grasp and redox domains
MPKKDKTEKDLKAAGDLTRKNGDPEKAAWLTAFYIENHLDPFAYPGQVASPEQIRFMVYLEEDQRYYPCSDQMYNAILNKNRSGFIQEEYRRALDKVLALITEKIEDPKERQYLETLIRIKYHHETRDEMMIPSRLEKRLTQIFINRTQIEDPNIFEKTGRNRQAARVLESAAFQQALNHWDVLGTNNQPRTLAEVKALTEQLELRRLLTMTGESAMWLSSPPRPYTREDFLEIFDRPITGNGAADFFQLFGTKCHEGICHTSAKRFLWLADEAGELMVDLGIISYLADRGHKIILAFKGGPMFTTVDFNNAQQDQAILERLGNAHFIKNPVMGKNELVKIFRSDNDIIILPDGSREKLNLLLTSTTFARAFKEVDAVISRGHHQRRRFFDVHFQFTQDIYSIAAEPDGSVSIHFKPKHPSVIKFSHADLERKAKAIVSQMGTAKSEGMTVIFYSGIIGSIPGKIRTAKKIMSVFIQHLKSQSTMTHIINPSEYYEPGMDADDLMYMWEIVQTSGMIDIWRFQTYGDIVDAFQIMGSKVPPEWVGKDATYSTGCTKEMKIALEVQRRNPEMQIIGPSKEKFMRRDEYGVGKMYDQRL